MRSGSALLIGVVVLICIVGSALAVASEGAGAAPRTLLCSKPLHVHGRLLHRQPLADRRFLARLSGISRPVTIALVRGARARAFVAYPVGSKPPVAKTAPRSSPVVASGQLCISSQGVVSVSATSMLIYP